MSQSPSLTDRATRHRSRARKGLLALAASGLALTLSAAPASAEPVDGSASGLTADVVVSGPAGVEVVNVGVPPTPAVTCPPDASDEVVDIGVPSVLSTGVLTVDCATVDGVLAAEAAVTDLNLLDEITAAVVAAECTANGGVGGSSQLVDATLFGEPVEADPEPNTVITIPGLGSVTLNRQVITTDSDGNDTITVDALVISLDASIPEVGPVPAELTALLEALPPELGVLLVAGSGITAEIVVSSTTCTASPDVAPTVPPSTGDVGSATTAPPPPVGELPRTGGGTSTGTIAGLGVALLAAGALSLAASRRARGSHTA